VVRVPEITNESRLRLTLRIDFCASFKTLSGEQPFKGSRCKVKRRLPLQHGASGCRFRNSVVHCLHRNLSGWVLVLRNEQKRLATRSRSWA
jgi:hypothetical protein